MSVFIVGLSYGDRIALSYTRCMLKNFLAFRYSHIIPIRRSPSHALLMRPLSLIWGERRRRGFRPHLVSGEDPIDSRPSVAKAQMPGRGRAIKFQRCVCFRRVRLSVQSRQKGIPESPIGSLRGPTFQPTFYPPYYTVDGGQLCPGPYNSSPPEAFQRPTMPQSIDRAGWEIGMG